MKSLIDCVTDNNIERVIHLLAQPETDVNATYNNGNTALHLAAFSGRTEIAKALLKKGANVNAADNEGNTALHLAAFCGRTETTKALLEKGANVNAVNIDGNTALHFAARHGRTEIAKALLQKDGINVNAVNIDGNTPLNFAALCGRTETTKALLEKGATANAETVDIINNLFKDKENAPKMVPVPGKEGLFCLQEFLLAKQAQTAAIIAVFGGYKRTTFGGNHLARIIGKMVLESPLKKFTDLIEEQKRNEGKEAEDRCL